MVSRFRIRGLRVVHQAHPGRLTAIALTVRAGARCDGRHAGLAHLAEHMLFQGTDGLDQLALNRRAAELGGEHNADTGYEDISLTFEVFNEDLDAALGLLAEQFYRTSVDARRLRKEQRVVMEEIRGRLDDPADRVYRRAWERMFGGAIAHPVAGSIASVSRIRPADVARFLRTRLVHPNTVGGSLRLHDRDSSQAYVTLLMPVAPTPRTLLATGVALDIVGADPDSRLFQELRERLGLSYEVGAHVEWGPDWACAVVAASGGRSRAERLVRAVEATCQRAAEEGFAGDELERARKKLRYRYAILADSRLDQAVSLAESALWGFPTPAETERIVASLARAEIEAAWRAAVSGRGVRAILT